jgi:formate C-acetyltransferase
LILSSPYEICTERAKHYTDVYKETDGLHPSKRAALALKRTLEKMTIYILPHELIVGNRTSKKVGMIIPVERGDFSQVLKHYMSELRNRSYRPFVISKREEEILKKEIFPYWEEKCVNAIKTSYWENKKLFVIPKLKIKPVIQMAIGKQKGLEGYTSWKDIKISKFLDSINPQVIMSIADMQGHLVVGHCNILDTGISGIRARIKNALKSQKDRNKKNVLEAMLIACDAFSIFAKRFASEALKKSKAERNVIRKKELELIAHNCAHIAEKKPETFYQAIQLLWLFQTAALISHGAFAIFAIGRADQYLYEYYKKDIASGRITAQFAYELICELLIKLSYNIFALPDIFKASASELGADNQAVTVGGVKKDGTDATNELSYMFIDAAGALKNMTNSFSIRLNSNAPSEFIRKCIELYRMTSGPALFNDDVIINALVKDGCSLEDARDYAIVGCVEPTPQGCTFGCTSANDLSLGGVLELTLLNGRLNMTRNTISIQTGDVRNFQTFDDLKNAFKKQLAYHISKMARAINLKDKVYKEGFHNPLVSLSLTGCIENGMDMTEGGAKYNFSSITGKGFATVVNSLAAIKKAVFDDKYVSMDNLLSALKNDFKKSEILRQYLIKKCPKFGTDDDYADELARWLADLFCKMVKTKKNERNGIFRPAFFSYGMHVSDGAVLAATPDGRAAAEPLSNSFSPANGTEVLGPTAVIMSLSKIDHSLISNGNALNMRLNPDFLMTEEGVKKIAALVTTYFKMMGMHIQFNVVSTETLRDAQRNPDKYRDLIVRVSGYTAYFVDLGKPIQEDIIKRTVFCDV